MQALHNTNAAMSSKFRSDPCCHSLDPMAELLQCRHSAEIAELKLNLETDCSEDDHEAHALESLLGPYMTQGKYGSYVA
jgi:hypothetical protein